MLGGGAGMMLTPFSAVAALERRSARPSRSPLATAAQRLLDGRALALLATHDFSAAMADAKADFLSGYLGVPTEEALSRLDNAIAELTFGMVQTAINNDPYRPHVYWVATTPHQWFGRTLPGSRWAFDNPDTIYRTVPIDPASHYVIHGRRRGAGLADQAFSLVSNLTTQTTVAYLDGLAIRSRRDPSYTVTIGPEPADGRRNHLQSTKDTVQLFIRSTMADWRRQRPDSLEVRRTDSGAIPAPPTTDQLVDTVNELIAEGGAVFGDALLGAKTMSQPVNTMPKPGKTTGALVTQYNSFSHFSLSNDETLVVTMDPAGAGYITVPVTDPWMIGVNPAAQQSSLNEHQSYRNPDGTHTYVIAAFDPGVHNWLSTAGESQGTLMARWQRLPAKLTAAPSIATHLVPREDLSDALPRGMPVVGPAARRRSLAERERLYALRFAT